MKLIYIIWCLIIVFASGVLFSWYFTNNGKNSAILDPRAKSLMFKNNELGEKSLFVPYWTLGKKNINVSGFNSVIYFGISVDKQGIDVNGEGFKQIGNFLKDFSPVKKKYLAVQMTDSELNSEILKDKNLQSEIINKTVTIVQDNGFNGILLDFEISGLPFDSLTSSITKFTADFAKKSHQEKILFYSAIYGDAFYRLRPYDISDIAKKTDGIFVMAYDFHKAGGDPGANFPLNAESNEDYDFKKMIKDFIHAVPVSKINIVFGMFGYDWKVNEKGQSITTGSALSDNEITQNFLKNCSFSNCQVKRDELSSETEVTYKDSENISHEVWFEDMQSVENKKNFLNTQKINSLAFWAYSYF